MVDMTKNTTEKNSHRVIFVACSFVLTCSRVHGTSNVVQALGFCFSMVPAIRRLYPENNDARKQAIKRHLEFFSTHPYVAAPVLGVTRWRWKAARQWRRD